MRVTQSMLQQTAIDGMQTNLLRLSKTQVQAATAKRINKPEDDPFAVEQALGFRSRIKSGEATLDNIALSKDWLFATDQALSDVNGVLLRAQDLTLRGANDTLSSAERQTLSTEVNELLEQAVAIGNTRHGDQYIFSGFKIDTLPFERTPATGPITGITYNGDNGEMLREAEPGIEISINASDETLFTNVFDSLIDLRDALQTDPFVRTDVEAVMGDVKTEMDSVMDMQAAMGTKLRRLETTSMRIEASQTGLKKLLSDAEDADMAEVLTNLQQQQFVYEAALNVNARVMQMSLLDFLR